MIIGAIGIAGAAALECMQVPITARARGDTGAACSRMHASAHHGARSSPQVRMRGGEGPC